MLSIPFNAGFNSASNIAMYFISRIMVSQEKAAAMTGRLFSE